MWKNLVLYRLLKVCVNGEDSCKEAAKYFKCQPKCEPGDVLIDYETVHYYGVLSKRDDRWYIQNGFEEVQIQIISETVGTRTTDLSEPVHIFAAVPIPDPDADFLTVEDDDAWEIPVAMLVTTDNIYQMVNVLKTVEEKHRALSELYFLPMDQKTTVYRFFMNNDVFAKNMIRCLGFMSSAKIDMKISFMIDPEVFHNEHIIPSDYIIDIAQTAATRLPGLLVSVKVETNGTWAEHIFGTECKEGSREENK